MREPAVPLPERTGRLKALAASLRGRGHGGRPLVATATLLGESEGRLTLSLETLADAARAARFSEDSWREVIVVAQSGPSALLLPMPDGIRMVGIISEQEIPLGLTTPVAVVSGVIGAREQIAEGSLVLLDPVRGRVLVEPDAKEVAAMQAQTHRPRFRIGGDSVPATTQEGRVVFVSALIQEAAEVETALQAGADSLYIPATTDILQPLAREENGAALKKLREVVEAFGGGAITLALSAEMFAPLILTRIAAISLLQVAVYPSDLPLPPADVLFEMEKLARQEENAGNLAGIFGLSALGPDLDAPETGDFALIYLAGEIAATLTPERLFSLPPVHALFDNPFDDSLTGFDEAVAAGVAGVVVPVDRVSECKNRIRKIE